MTDPNTPATSPEPETLFGLEEMVLNFGPSTLPPMGC